MMRVLFLFCLSFCFLKADAQLPWNYPGAGIRMKKMISDSVAQIPSDTTNNKTGIARIGSTVYVGNGVKWTASGGSSDTNFVRPQRLADSAAAIRSALIDTAANIRGDFPTYTGVTQSQLDDTSAAIRNYVDANVKYIAADSGIVITMIGDTGRLSVDSDYVKRLIPDKFNPIAGSNITLSGTYPNITINASGSGGSNFTAGSNIQITGTSPNFTISAQKQFNSEINTFTQNNKFARIFAGVIRPNCPGANQPITWSFIDTTAYHNWINFDSVNSNGSQIQVYFQRAKNIVSFVAVPDESLALAGVQLGASVGDSVAIISPYTLRQPCGDFVGSDTGWVTTGIATSFRDYDPSTGITRFTPTLPGSRTIYNISPETYGTQITYVGPRNYRVRRIYWGLTSSQLIAFYLVDSVNNIVTGSLATTDRVVITVPRMGTEAIPSQTSASTGYPCDIYGGSSNIWLMAVMEMPIIGYPLDSSSVKLEWQVARKGSGNFATSYRITRATESSPNTETNIYTGSALTFTDTGLSKGTRYLYRMYATILGVESRVGDEQVKTLNE